MASLIGQSGPPGGHLGPYLDLCSHPRKESENRLALALQAAGIAFTREEYVDTRAVSERVYRRVDFLVELVAPSGRRGVYIAIENDEHQHGKEPVGDHCARMKAIAASLHRWPILFIRFNPHAFTTRGISEHLTYADRVCELVDGINALKRRVDSPLSRRLRPMTILYAFYDTAADGRPCITHDRLYAPELKSCIV